MDQSHGHGWRLVSDSCLTTTVRAGVTSIDLALEPEADGVVALWMQRHGAHAALVRPDHYVYGSATDAASAAALLDAWQNTQH
jgi:3-(3-hydroxy-phenyl)propionate hydroxylase